VHGTRLSSLILAGKNGAELADKGASAMTDCALDWVSDMFGSSVKKSIVRTQAFSWNKQPWTLGALSSGNPGALEARKALAEPVNGVLWFAGEAVIKPIGLPAVAPGRTANVRLMQLLHI